MRLVAGSRYCAGDPASQERLDSNSYQTVRTTDSLFVLTRAARRRSSSHLRMLPSCCRIDEVSFAVFVVMPHPRHGVLKSRLIAPFWHQVKKVIGADENIEPSCIR